MRRRTLWVILKASTDGDLDPVFATLVNLPMVVEEDFAAANHDRARAPFTYRCSPELTTISVWRRRAAANWAGDIVLWHTFALAASGSPPCFCSLTERTCSSASTRRSGGARGRVVP